MKRIVKKPIVPVSLASQKKPIMRKCGRDTCMNDLSKQQKKYCSKVCHAIAFKGGVPGIGRDPIYKAEFAGKIFDDFLLYCKEGHNPTLIPTDSSFIVIHNARIPTYDEFCEYLIENKHVKSVSEASIKHWGNVHVEFAEALDRMHRVQKSFLINNGLAGRFNSKIASLMLGVNHGIIEKKEVDVSHKLLGVVKHLYAKTDQLEAGGQTPPKVHEQPQP